VIACLNESSRLFISRGRRGGSFLESDTVFNALLEYIHGQNPSVQHFIVEGTNIEFITELILGVLTQFQYLKLPNFVPVPGELLFRQPTGM
jgi:hypothetical protein